MARKKKPKYSPLPPPGSYDPALDAQRRAASRGLGDVTADAGTAGLRDTVDYGLGREDILRGQTRGLEDLTTGRDRGYQDIDRNLASLHRGFGILGDRQRQQINAAGLGGGGAKLQAAAKRAANEAWDRQPLDTARTRVGEDFTRGSTRLGEDTAGSLGKLALEMAPPDAGNPMGGRRFQDRATTVSRAGREDVNFGKDIEAQKAFQATQSIGWTPPPAPLAAPLRVTGGPPTRGPGPNRWGSTTTAYKRWRKGRR